MQMRLSLNSMYLNLLDLENFHARNQYYAHGGSLMRKFTVVINDIPKLRYEKSFEMKHVTV